MIIFEFIALIIVAVGAILGLLWLLGWLTRREQTRIARSTEELKAEERPDYLSGIWCECHPPIGLHPKGESFSETRIIQFK